MVSMAQPRSSSVQTQLDKALSAVAGKPGISGESLARTVGLNVYYMGENSRRKWCAATIRFLHRLAECCDIRHSPRSPKQLLSPAMIFKARFYPVGYPIPELFKPVAGWIPPSDLEVPAQFCPRPAAPLKERRSAPVAPVESHCNLPESPIAEPEPIMEMTEQPTEQAQVELSVKQRLQEALALAVKSGNRFTMADVTKAAQVGNSTIYNKTYEAELAQIRAAVRKSKSGSKAVRSPKAAVKEEAAARLSQPLAYFQQLQAESQSRLAELQKLIEEEYDYEQALAVMLNHHSRAKSPPLSLDPLESLPLISSNGNGHKSAN